ncbi:hypothetical protein [Streptosporangium carneum]|uniref:Uncharacterized protein n=1 Tax=Streptosporangium carneum TaxID=47481 RepID=A0A9W6MF25_9ACTN|nr:hypothetical protein GCM10017600_56130 [Streptosporangium carneum]
MNRIAPNRTPGGDPPCPTIEFPDDLIAAQQAYWEAGARVQEVTDALPSSVAVLAGEAEVTEEQRAAEA